MMKTKLLALALLGVGSMFAQTRFSISIGTGGYNRGYAQPAYSSVQPPCPGPDYSWVAGYYSGPNSWVPGYWSRQPYNQSAYRDQDRYDNQPNYTYGRQSYNRPYDERQNRCFRHDRDDDDDRDRDRGRETNGYGNGFRNR